MKKIQLEGFKITPEEIIKSFPSLEKKEERVLLVNAPRTSLFMKGVIHEYHGGITKELTALGFAPGSIVDLRELPRLLQSGYRVALFPDPEKDLVYIGVTQHTSFGAR